MIKLPESNNKNKPKYELLKLKDKLLFIQQDPKGNKLFYMNNDEEFKLVGVMKTNENIVDAHIAEFKDGIIISKFNFGSELFTIDENRLRRAELISNSPLSKNTIIETVFYKDSITYMLFKGDSNIYKYDNKLKDIVSTSFFKNNTHFVERIMHQDNKGYSLFKQAEGQQSQIQIFSNFQEGPIWSHIFNHETINRSVFASRNLTKEVIFDNYNVLEVFIFEKNPIITFLNGLSIRSMTQIESNIVLIATDFNGWYLLDVKNKSIAPYWPLRNQNKITPQLNRDIYADNNTIWSNNGSNLLKVNFHSRKTENFQFFNNLAAITQNQKKIFLADVEGSLKVFDKETHQFNTLIEKDSLNYENLVLLQNSIYAATSKGLKHVVNQEIKLYIPNNYEEDSYVVSIVKYKEKKLLIGTRSGKLFEFDTTSKLFKELYQDKLSASIASILVDTKNRIWLNTFAGIVVFNPKSKEAIRFGVNDGLSHYEANRFSALKLDSGHFLIGTVKGLNYFHPDSLIKSYNKNRFNHKLEYVSIKKYDSKSESIKTILSRKELDSIQTIMLPAENKNLVVNFGILKSQLNITYFYRYRLKNSDWMEVDNNHEIRLLNLESGNYNLEIQALDKTKNQVLTSLSTRLVVKEFFYEAIWFYTLLLVVILSIIFVYTYKWRQVNKTIFKNKLLHTEIEYKKKDLTDLATNITRNQQWNDYLIIKMEEIREAKGRKKGTAIVNLEIEIKEKNKVMENNYDFHKRIDVLSNEFYNSLLKRYPNLSKNEIKLCSLIQLDLDNQDIAILQNVEVSSVYKSRYRLRKKLNLTLDTDLNAFLKVF